MTNSYVVSKEEAGNPAFQWEVTQGGGWPICAHQRHQDLGDGWICEPCEHCGSEVRGVDWYDPLHSVQISSGYYILHPCGHVMQTLDFVKEKV